MLNLQEKLYLLMLKSNAKSFPIDIFNFAVDGFSWVITSKSKAKRLGLFQSDFMREYAQAHVGFTIVMDDGDNIIVFDDNLDHISLIILISHEITHNLLKHSSFNGILGKSNDKETEDRQEKEAVYGGLILLAPPCVLLNNGIVDPVNIEKLTALPAEQAKFIAGEIQHYKLTKQTQVEKDLCLKFNANGCRAFQARKIAVLSMAVLVAGLLMYYISRISYTLPQAEVSPTPTAAITLTENMVYVTLSGNRFHKENCKHLAKAEVFTFTVAEAIKKGYGACLDCKPLE